MILTKLLDLLNSYVFSPLLPILIFGAGILFSVKLRFFYILHPIRIFRVFFPKREKRKSISSGTKKGGVSSFKALTLALAGTLGVGNIIGVSAAIMAGGCGSIFWMWCSAVAAMVVKYAEIVLAVKTRKNICSDDGTVKHHGGAMYYIKNHRLSVFFAGLCMIGSFTLGNVIQIRAASDALKSTFGIHPIFVGAIAAIVCALVIGGGVAGISDFTGKLIPFLTILYIIASVYIIAVNAEQIPSVIGRIINEAFAPSAAAGGIGGFLLSRGMRYGITRGLFSNEAGCGTAPIAHAEAETDSPAAQGCFGIFEVFVDTILLCTMTAFVVILAFDTVGLSCATDSSGMLLVIRSYSLWLGKAAEIFISLSTAFFALATLICWAHYGLEGLHYITEKHNSASIREKRYKPKKIYIMLYCLAALFGCFLSGGFIWSLADLTVGIMTLLNVCVIFMRREEIAEETRRFFKKSDAQCKSNISFHSCPKKKSPLSSGSISPR